MSKEGIPKNYYALLPKDILPSKSKKEKKKELESFKKHRINENFRMILNGKTSSGKTNTLMDLLVRMNDTFDLIILVTPMTDEPFYEYLKRILPEEQFHVYTYKKDPMPKVQDYYNFKGKILAIFDDMMTAKTKDQELITDFYSFGRKLGSGSGFCSCVYITQHFFRVPIAIRANTEYVILKQMSDEDDKHRIKIKFGKRMDTDQFYRMFDYCNDTPESFMLIDIRAPKKDRFRRGFLEIVDPDDFIQEKKSDGK